MGIQSYALPHPVSDPPAPATAKKGRAQRELSNTKRAAQNRAAQRAFRQRKEQHIHKLEDNLKILQQENYTLRDYIARLQAMLTDNKIAFPPAPEPLPQVSTSAPASDDQPSLQQQHHQEQHYTQSSPPQAHSPVPPHAYPPSSHSASQHAPLTNNHHPVRHEPADAITQLQAAAVQADDMATPYVPPPQQSSPQTSQYVPASEYPAENPATLTETRPCKYPSRHVSYTF
jgi:hypothetical protein